MATHQIAFYVNMVIFLYILFTRQRKFMSTFWTFRHATLNEGWAPGTREGSAVGYVESEAASGTLNYSLSLGQSEPLLFDP